MAASHNQQTPIDQVLAEFDGKKDVHVAFCERTKSLVEELLKDAGIRYQSVQARVKTRDKLKEKYIDPKKNYKGLNDITDQVAVRVITYYEDEVDRVAEIIAREFVIDPRSVDKRETEPEKFGYYALNYVCKYSTGRVSHVEYKKFADVYCEIQITSILRHAWSEIEHPWYDLKDAFPDDIKRRFARMAALLEIAESEFLSLRKIQSDYMQSVAVQVETGVPDIPVDAVSMRTFIEQESLVSEVDKSIALVVGVSFSETLPDSAVETRSAAAKAAGMTKLQEVRDSLEKYKADIPEFVRRCLQDVWSPNPPGTHAARGLCIYQLSQFLVSVKGTNETIEFLRMFQLDRTIDVARQVAIAQELAAKRSN